MSEKEQVKPLAPAISHTHRVLHIDEEDQALSMEMKHNHKHRKCIKCCGCITAIFLILAVIVLVLAFTAFRIKDPVLKMNSVMIQGLELGPGSTLLPGTNLTLTADVSVKNPNAASFKFDNATTNVYYDGGVVGAALSPAGTARARKRVELNVTIDVLVDKILAASRLGGDLVAGALPVSSYTRISGKVKIWIVKKHVVVRMNCTMTIETRSQSIRDQNCKRSVSL